LNVSRYGRVSAGLCPGAGFGSGPKLMVFDTRRLTEKYPRPLPKFLGMIVLPGNGARSNAPKEVCTTDCRLRSVAKAGLSAKIESLLRSAPVMILKGAPERATISGAKLRPQRVSMLPARVNRWRMSVEARPNSVARLYDSDGKLPGPSVSPSPLPS